MYKIKCLFLNYRHLYDVKLMIFTTFCLWIVGAILVHTLMQLYISQVKFLNLNVNFMLLFTHNDLHESVKSV